MQHQSPWHEFIETCDSCRACDLGYERLNVVVHRGAIKAPLMIIGEGPGAQEDEQGKPFVGRSGQLLDAMLTAWDIPDSHYHIANIVKCRPPENRAPTLEEAKACRPLLAQQFKFVDPKVVLLMGASAYKFFTGDLQGSITKLRGQWIERGNLLVMPTFHPAYILRSQSKKPDLFQDIGAARKKLTELGIMPSFTLE